MHATSIDRWRHEHAFLGSNHARNERRTWIVVGITAVTMVAEIAAGAAFGSMALLADGVHMATHAGALSISALAYWWARRCAGDPRYSFGPGKFGELAAFASAVVLAVTALLVGFESLSRLANPTPIRFGEAIAVAVLGLAVNLYSARILHESGHDHGHGHHGHDHHGHGEHGHEHGHAHHGPVEHGTGERPAGDHHDHNLRAAYLHVLTDALTSVLAIAGLVAGLAYGWTWMDPMIGVLGSIVIAWWALGLLRSAGAVLVDAVPDRGLADAIAARLERGGDRLTDLHLWRVGPGHLAAIVSIVSDAPEPPERYKARIADLPTLSHVTVEVHPCQNHGG